MLPDFVPWYPNLATIQKSLNHTLSNFCNATLLHPTSCMVLYFGYISLETIFGQPGL